MTTTRSQTSEQHIYVTDQGSAAMSDRLERFWQMGAVECAICLGVLSQPKFLSCLHTFCLACLNQLHRASNNEVLCPTCRASTVVPPEGPKGLRTNFIVDQMLEFRKLCDVTCHACADSSSSSSSSSSTAVAMATAYCVDCGDNLCENCVSAHRKIRTLKSHRLLEVGANDALELKQLFCSRPIYCADHPDQAVALYCTDCSTSICLSCCVLSHKTHGYVDIKEKANESRKELENVMDAVSEKKSYLLKAGVELERNLATMNASATQTISEITKRSNEFIAYIRCQESSRLEIVRKFQDQFKEQIDKMLEDIQTKIASIENFLPFCRQLRDRGTHSDLLSLSPQICSTADEIRTANFTRVSLPSLVFTPADGNLSVFNFLGNVKVVEAEEDFCTKDQIEEPLRKFNTWKMKNANCKADSSTENGSNSVELKSSVRRENNNPAANPRSISTTGSNPVAPFIPTSVPGQPTVSLVSDNCTEKNQVDRISSNPLATSAGTTGSSSNSCLQNFEMRRTFEAQMSYSISSSSSSSDADVNDLSSEDDVYTDNSSGHRQNKNRDSNSTHDRNANSRRPSDDLPMNRPGLRNVTPSLVPQFSLAYGSVEAPRKTCKGSADIETIPGVEPVVGLAILGQFLFVLRRNSNELERYDPTSLRLVCREPIKDLAQPTDLTACARSHTLYIGHTRKSVFSVKISHSTPMPQKLSVAFNYAHLSTTSNCSVLMGCPKAEAILEYNEVPHWRLIRHIPMVGAYPTGMVQLSANRFAVSSKMNVLYIITEEGPKMTCEKVTVPHNMSHMVADISSAHLLVADCYGHQIRKLEPSGQGEARSSPILEAKTISKPCRLWTDKVGRRLFVGTTQGDIKVLHLN